MLLDGRDLDILRLAGKYRWLPYDTLGRFGFDDLIQEIDKLSSVNLLCVSRNKKYIIPSARGYGLLQDNGYDYDPGSKRAYIGSSALRRRLEVAEIMLTALRAGIDVHRDDVDGLQSQPVFLPAFSLRNAEINPMSSASCAGFGHWGNKAYMLQYISPESPGMYYASEIRLINNLASVFDKSLKTPSALIFAGASYGQVYKQITDAAPSKRHGVKSFYDYWDVWRKSDIPVHILSCDAIGAKQLAFMSQPDHNAKIAKASFGERWTPRDDEIPEADGCVDGIPLVVAADMNVRRLNRVCECARALGRKEVMAAAFLEQMQSFLLKILPTDGLVTPLSIEEPVIEAAFSKRLSLYSMDKDTAAVGPKGAVIHA